MKLTRVHVGSANPVKIGSARRALAALGHVPEVIGVPAAVDVPDQPFGDDQTLLGARLRAEAVMDGCDLAIGIEGGVCDAPGRPGVLDAMAWVVCLSGSVRGTARTATFELPPTLTALLRAGVELGDADDRTFGHTNNKQRGGTVGTLTGGLITRTDYYVHAVTLALLPIVRHELYGGHS